ncbi:MAG TPA: dephospho-CoA kinase [Clostridia bacterium]|nr:dephospho-CoA kinase [Clostridia bacterium]
MIVIGLTGGIACGKTTLSHALRALGASVLDADAFSREATAEGGEALPAIRARFGPAVFDAQGRLNRAALGEIVFSDPRARHDLEGIVHPAVTRRILSELDRLRRNGASLAVLDVPLLFEAGMEGLADEVWVAYLPEELQIRRLMARDGMAREQALRRIRSQMPLSEKLRRADVIIPTTGSRAQSADRVRAQWERVMRKGKDGA